MTAADDIAAILAECAKGEAHYERARAIAEQRETDPAWYQLLCLMPDGRQARGCALGMLKALEKEK